MLVNEPFGWLWIHLGIVSGMLLGTGFLREGFLGGYGSPRRRLLRLGHISFIGLGILNILFAQTMRDVEPNSLMGISSIAFIVAAIAMPLCCAVVAWRQEWRHVFAAPVLAALTATGLLAWELLT